MKDTYSKMFIWREDVANLVIEQLKLEEIPRREINDKDEIDKLLSEHPEINRSYFVGWINKRIEDNRPIELESQMDYWFLLEHSYLDDALGIFKKLCSNVVMDYSEIIKIYDELLFKKMVLAICERDKKELIAFISFFDTPLYNCRKQNKTAGMVATLKQHSYKSFKETEQIKKRLLLKNDPEEILNHSSELLSSMFEGTLNISDIDKEALHLFKIQMIQEEILNLFLAYVYKKTEPYIIENIEAVIDTILHGANMNYDLLRYHLNKNNNKISQEDLLKLFRTAQIIIGVKMILTSDIMEPAYYTKIETMLHLYLDENHKISKNKLAIMNIDYMNDPEEGKVLDGYLGFNECETREIKVPNVYVKSFTTLKDFLPMWSLYGDNGKGCCLVISENSINNINKEARNYYKVAYANISDSGDIKIVNNFGDSKINTDLEDLIKELKTVCENSKQELVDSIRIFIQGITYLFKDASYSYENESRLVYLEIDETKTRHTKSPKPLVYIECEQDIDIKEIILGPRFEDSGYNAVYLKDLITKATNKNNTPKLKESCIKYR